MSNPVFFLVAFCENYYERSITNQSEHRILYNLSNRWILGIMLRMTKISGSSIDYSDKTS